MSTSTPEILFKSEVMQCLGVSDRTLEKLVKANKFPPPLRLGKHAVWSKEAVGSWLARALKPQLDWEPPRKRGRPAANLSHKLSA